MQSGAAGFEMETQSATTWRPPAVAPGIGRERRVDVRRCGTVAAGFTAVGARAPRRRRASSGSGAPGPSMGCAPRSGFRSGEPSARRCVGWMNSSAPWAQIRGTSVSLSRDPWPFAPPSTGASPRSVDAALRPSAVLGCGLGAGCGALEMRPESLPALDQAAQISVAHQAEPIHGFDLHGSRWFLPGRQVSSTGRGSSRPTVAAE
jgi:hypothetical protein